MASQGCGAKFCKPIANVLVDLHSYKIHDKICSPPVYQSQESAKSVRKFPTGCQVLTGQQTAETEVQEIDGHKNVEMRSGKY